MKTVYLTSGPRGSGKSVYTKKVVELCPGLTLISRDEILIELFGTTSLDKYTGGHYAAMELLFRMINESLSSREEVSIILDCWNGFSGERQTLIKKLRDLGVDNVICWQFITPVDTCVRWFFEKPDSKGYSKTGIRGDHGLYHEMAKGIEEDGFDLVCRVDPSQSIELPALLLSG